jgi:Fe-S-cluster containining protein
MKDLGLEKEEELDIFWLCLAEECPLNCCGKQFDNGNVVSFYNMHHDQVPLLPHEKNKIVKCKGIKHVKIEKDGLFYLDIPEHESCPFLDNSRCSIQEMKPSLCKAYPLIQLDGHVGPIFDHENCPGFAYGKEKSIRMKKQEYMVMLESFIDLQQYRLERLSLQLKKMKYAV